MGNELIIALLAIGFVGSLAAFFVMWSFYDGQKKLTKEERDRRWDEISRALSIEKELEQSKAREKCSAQSVLWYAESLKLEKEVLNSWKHEYDWLWKEKSKMQDRLSALLCPHNDHAWKDGICTKCGRSEQK